MVAKMTPSIRLLFYVAHPVGAPTAEEIRANCERTKRWLAWLWRTYPACDFAAPWLGTVEALPGCGPEDHARGLAIDVRIVTAFDAVALCGPRISTGMATEAEAHGFVWDLTGPILPGCQEGGPPKIDVRWYVPGGADHGRPPRTGDLPLHMRRLLEGTAP